MIQKVAVISTSRGDRMVNEWPDFTPGDHGVVKTGPSHYRRDRSVPPVAKADEADYLKRGVLPFGLLKYL